MNQTEELKEQKREHSIDSRFAKGSQVAAAEKGEPGRAAVSVGERAER